MSREDAIRKPRKRQPTDGEITAAERNVLDALAVAADAFKSLPVQLHDDEMDFASALRVAENVVARRVSKRINPDAWRT